MTETEKQILNNQLTIMEALKCLLNEFNDYAMTYDILNIKINKTNLLIKETK